MRAPALAAASAAVITIGVVAGCGSSSSGSGQAPARAGGVTSGAPTGTTGAPAVDPNAPEANPAGDIPDNQAFVTYSPPAAGYSVKVPEGWARTAARGAVTFTDKLNAIRLESRPAAAAPTVAGARAKDVAALSRTVPGYRAGRVTAVTRSAGTGVRITYLANAPTDPVTGKRRTDAVERYVFFHHGRDAMLTLSGPQGADNVDPWMIVTDSVAWTR